MRIKEFGCDTHLVFVVSPTEEREDNSFYENIIYDYLFRIGDKHKNIRLSKEPIKIEKYMDGIFYVHVLFFVGKNTMEESFNTLAQKMMITRLDENLRLQQVMRGHAIY